MAAFMLNPALDRGLVKQKRIIRAERIETTTSRRMRAERALGRAVFGNHPLALAGAWPYDSELERLKMSDVRKMHLQFYNPVNMFVVCIGGIQADALLTKLERFSVGRPGSVKLRPAPFDFSQRDAGEVDPGSVPE